jgi:hypothetical protein
MGENKTSTATLFFLTFRRRVNGVRYNNGWNAGGELWIGNREMGKGVGTKEYYFVTFILRKKVQDYRVYTYTDYIYGKVLLDISLGCFNR